MDDALPPNRLCIGHELGVRLIEHHEHGGRHLSHERPELVIRDHCARRVVGAAHDHKAGAIGDRGEHGRQIVPVVGGVGNLHAGRAGCGDEQRVGLEAAPRVHDLVARGTGGRDDLRQHRHRTRADLDALGRDAVASAETVAQSSGRALGVAVDAALGDGLKHRLERLERILVARELERIVGCRPSLSVGHHLLDLRPQLHSGLRHGPQPNCATGRRSAAAAIAAGERVRA